MWSAIKKLLQDPPPAYVFELSEEGIAWAATGAASRMGFEPFERSALAINPQRDNVIDEGELIRTILRIAPPGGAKARPCALVLPDYCGRVVVLDFDTFPSKAEEQLALVKFRVKKLLSFDIETAAVSFAVQAQEGKRYEVVAAVVMLEIVARYEAAFRAAGFHPGAVTTSSLSGLPLVKGPGVVVAARLTGRVLSVSVVDSGRLKLARFVELPEANREEVDAVLIPTLAYIEDELKSRPAVMLACGFGALARDTDWQSDLGLTVRALESKLGAPSARDAGLLGFLEQQEVA